MFNKLKRIEMFLLLAVSACVPVAYGPKTEKKSPANYLSGEHYDSTATVGPVSLLKRKEVVTMVSGRLVLGEGLESVSLKHQRLKLLKDDKVVAETTSDLDGNYSFFGHLSDGSYRILLDSDKFTASQSIEVRGYKLKDIIIFASPMN